jgi:hypothetical protein
MLHSAPVSCSSSTWAHTSWDNAGADLSRSDRTEQRCADGHCALAMRVLAARESREETEAGRIRVASVALASLPIRIATFLCKMVGRCGEESTPKSRSSEGNSERRSLRHPRWHRSWPLRERGDRLTGDSPAPTPLAGVACLRYGSRCTRVFARWKASRLRAASPAASAVSPAARTGHSRACRHLSQARAQTRWTPARKFLAVFS